MKTSAKLLILLIGFIFSIMSCNVDSNEKLDQLEIEKEKIRQADIAWAKTGETKDLDAQMELYSDDQIPMMMPPNGPIVKGKENIRAFFEPTYNRSDFSVTWHPETVEIAKSGEIGFVIQMRMIISFHRERTQAFRKCGHINRCFDFTRVRGRLFGPQDILGETSGSAGPVRIGVNVDAQFLAPFGQGFLHRLVVAAVTVER